MHKSRCKYKKLQVYMAAVYKGYNKCSFDNCEACINHMDTAQSNGTFSGSSWSAEGKGACYVHNSLPLDLVSNGRKFCKVLE